MQRIGHVGLAGLAALAALGLTATSASAATTTVRSGSASGSAYSGSVTATLDGSASVTAGSVSGSCSSSTLGGTTTSAGVLSFSSATFGGCSSATITAQSLPWSGSITYNPVSGGKDGDVSIKVSIKAVVSILTCNYGGTLAGSIYNPDNANRPDTSVSQAEIQFTSASVPLTSGFLCPSSASLTALFQASGASGAALWVTS